MNCNFNQTNNCVCCKNLVTTTSITLLGNTLTLIVPDMSLSNCKSVCVKIGQQLPVGITLNTIVILQVGLVPRLVLTNCAGNFLYADQIQSCKIYCFKFATDTGLFLYKGGWRLCPTKHIFNCIPLVAITTIGNIDINSIITQDTKNIKTAKSTKTEPTDTTATKTPNKGE